MSSQISRPSQMPDENTIKKQVLEIHKPDGSNIVNLRNILEVVDNILSSDSTGGGRTLEEQLQREYDNTDIPFKIKLLSHQSLQMPSFKWNGEMDLYNMTINMLKLLSTYEWEAKAVLIVAALANNHGNFGILTKVSNKNRLAKRVSVLKPKTPPSSNDDMKKSTEETVKTILSLTKHMLEYKEMPTLMELNWELIEKDADVTAGTNFEMNVNYKDKLLELISSAIFEIAQAALICASHLNSSGRNGFGIPAERLDKLKMSFQQKDIYFQSLLKDCHKKIEEKEAQISYEALKRVFDYSDGHSNNIKDIFKLLFNVKDEHKMPLSKGGETTEEEKKDVLPTDKKMLLLISSGLDISEEMAVYLEKFYKECSEDHEMIWIPIVKCPNKFWTAEKVKEFERLQSHMGLYSTNDPRKSIAPGLHKFVENDLFQSDEKDFIRIGNEPIVLVLDSKGKIVHKNAMNMILAWGVDASPFDTYTEQNMLIKEKWRPKLVAGKIDPICHWINVEAQGAKEDYIFLLGGNDIEWVKQFIVEVKKTFSPLDNIESKMMYVGKSKQVRSSIAPSDSLDGPTTWLFWARVKTMLLSRMHHLLTKTSPKQGDDDDIVKGLKKLLAYEAPGETGGGWSLLCTKDEVVRCGDGHKMLKVVTENQTWKDNVNGDKRFHVAFDEYYNNLPSDIPHHQPFCGLEYPCELQPPIVFTEISENEICPDCDTDMYKLITFTCCHGHDDCDVGEEKEEEDATNK